MYTLFLLPMIVVAIYFLSQIYRDFVRGSYGWAAFGAVAVVLVFHMASTS